MKIGQIVWNCEIRAFYQYKPNSTHQHQHLVWSVEVEAHLEDNASRVRGPDKLGRHLTSEVFAPIAQGDKDNFGLIRL